MKHTSAKIAFNPQDVGVVEPFGDTTVKCSVGKMTLGGKTYSVAAKTVTPKTSATKTVHTEITLVFDGSKVFYQPDFSGPGIQPPEFDSRGLRPLVRLAFIVIPAGKTLADADGQIVTVEPMIETVYKKQIGADGKPLTKHVTEKFPDGSVTERDVPLMEQVEKVITV